MDKLGVSIDEGVREIKEVPGWPTIRSMLDLIEGGPNALEAVKQFLKLKEGVVHSSGAFELRAPIVRPPQYRDAMCFHEHISQSFTAAAILGAKMMGDEDAIASATAATYEVPEVHFRQPVYYKGNRFAIGHPGQTITWPSYSEVMDFELELACVIGVGGKDISRERARGHIFGLTILNDLSARDAQGQEMAGMLGPAKGKDFDHANVFGPCIVTLDEFDDIYDLTMVARVNGEVWGAGSSKKMHWKFEDLIAHISKGETIYPGEIIGSGTVGNGCGLEHQRFLTDGDEVELEIEGIGKLRNKIIR